MSDLTALFDVHVCRKLGAYVQLTCKLSPSASATPSLVAVDANVSSDTVPSVPSAVWLGQIAMEWQAVVVLSVLT
jgi:hypothetical protein